MRQIICLRHYVKSMEKTYLHRTRRFLAYRKQARLTGEPVAADVKGFLTRLVMVEKVRASMQNQAFSGLLLLFREVLCKDLKEMAQTVRARRRLPTVLSVSEVQALLAAVEAYYNLMVKLLSGSGLRFVELLRLRMKDIDFDIDISEIEELLSHKSLETTTIYTHVVRELKTKARSPLDDL